MAAKVRQEINDELLKANQLLDLIKAEVTEVKKLTAQGGDMEQQLMKSAALIGQLESVRGIKIFTNRADEHAEPTQHSHLDQSL